MIRLADRRGILEGDVGLLQYRALEWLMQEEIEDSANIEREKIKATMVAVNPSLYKSLYESGAVDPIPDENIEWFTPTTEQEMDTLVAELEQMQVGSESF